MIPAVIAVGLYVLASRATWRSRRRPSPIPLAVDSAFVLLAEAIIAVAFARNWHASWWEWHLLMLVAFGVIAWWPGARTPRSASATSTSTRPPPARAR